MDDEEDPVVKEVPVFVSNALADNLYVFQYPVRPALMSYDASLVLSSRVRPQQSQVEVTLALDTQSANYDRSKGEQMALNVDGCDSKSDIEKLVFPSRIMDKQVLVSSKSMSDEECSRYCIALVKDGQIHLTPLKAVLSLKPDLAYLDASDKTARAEGRTADDNEDDKDDEDELKPVTVKFSKTDMETAKRSRERTFEYQQRKLAEEPWTSTRYHHFRSESYEKESKKLVCNEHTNDIGQTLKIQSASEYLESLTSIENEDK